MAQPPSDTELPAKDVEHSGSGSDPVSDVADAPAPNGGETAVKKTGPVSLQQVDDDPDDDVEAQKPAIVPTGAAAAQPSVRMDQLCLWPQPAALSSAKLPTRLHLGRHDGMA
eukprot:SAG31_NODE_4657_length_3064_cov_1.947049_1_plen_112_part_00